MCDKANTHIRALWNASPAARAQHTVSADRSGYSDVNGWRRIAGQGVKAIRLCALSFLHSLLDSFESPEGVTLYVNTCSLVCESIYTFFTLKKEKQIAIKKIKEIINEKRFVSSRQRSLCLFDEASVPQDDWYQPSGRGVQALMTFVK